VAEEVAVRDPTVAEPPVREEKMPETARKMFANREVEVALVAVALVNVCPPVQVLAFARLSEATASPDVGEMVSVPSEFDIEVTVPEAPASEPHCTFPFASVSSTEAPLQLRSVEMVTPCESTRRPASVEVAEVSKARVAIPPANVEVAVEVAVMTPVVREPIEVEERVESTARKEVA